MAHVVSDRERERKRKKRKMKKKRAKNRPVRSTRFIHIFLLSGADASLISLLIGASIDLSLARSIDRSTKQTRSTYARKIAELTLVRLDIQISRTKFPFLASDKYFSNDRNCLQNIPPGFPAYSTNLLRIKYILNVFLLVF